MERPLALWALLLALIPWLLLLRPPRSRIPRAPFPALVLLSSQRSRRRRARRRVLRAALRSLALAAFALLWATPKLDGFSASTVSEPPSLGTTIDDASAPGAILIVDGADSGRVAPTAPTSAHILALALDAQLDDVHVDRVASLDFAMRPDAMLNAYDAALVVDVSALAPKEEAALSRFAQTGAVLIWPGPNTDVARWNETLVRWNVDATITDATLKNAPAVANAPEERAFLDAFPGGATASIDALPCRRAIVVSGPGATAILRDRQSRAPVFSRLANDVCWFALSPDASFGALTATPAFPALVEATTRYPLERRMAAPPARDFAAAPRRALAFLLWSIALLAFFVELVSDSRVGANAFSR